MISIINRGRRKDIQILLDYGQGWKLSIWTHCIFTIHLALFT